MLNRTIFLVSILLITIHANTLFAQNKHLQSGPMVGYVDMKEALLWVQTNKAATVYFEYWDMANPTVVYKTDKVKTVKTNAFTAKCIADAVEPGKSYEYRLRINGKKVELPYPTVFKTQPLWQWRVDPPAFSVATGSCAYINEEPYDRPGKPYGSDYQIFTSIYRQRPDLMLWLGDNTYYREPDWSTRTGMLHRYTHDRSLPELQPLLASTSHYAIWDDHDFGPDNSDATWYMKETSLDVFKAFWGNPTYGVNGQPGCTSYFRYADVDFFLLDNRYFRSPDVCENCPRTMLGREQLDWLLAALAASKAPFKIVTMGGQMLTTNENHETYAHYYPDERNYILDFIERENIKGVVFLTGDRHFTELSTFKNAKGNDLYDLTASPITSGVYAEAAKELNANRVEGTLVVDHNFAMLRFSGPRTQRKLDITVYDANGKERWTRSIAATR